MVDYKELYSQVLHRNLSLEMENAELKDRLIELGETIQKEVQLPIFEENPNQLNLF